MTTATKPEQYLCPKDLSAALESQYGLTLSAAYVRSIRAESIRRGEGLFIGGSGRASEVFAWLKANPRFRAFPRESAPGCLSV